MNIKLIPNEDMQDQLYELVGKRHVVHIICEENRADIIDRTAKLMRQNKVKRKPVYCVQTNKTYPSIKEASIALGLDTGAISRCLSGKQKSTNGMTFTFKEQK